jgi:probable HAF family extracellular repeat protein
MKIIYGMMLSVMLGGGAVAQSALPLAEISPAQSLAPAASTRYYALDIGALSFSEETWGLRLNQTGQVIRNLNGHAYLYQNCQSRDLGHLGGGKALATGINNNGEIVGRSQAMGGRWRAFRYANGAMHDLGGSTQPLINEGATAVNFWGDIAGIESVQGNLALTAVRYVNGGVSTMARVSIPTPPGSLFVQKVVDINDSQEVLGSAQTSQGTLAFLSTNFGYLWGPVAGVPGLESITTPSALNRFGHIVGTAGNGFVRAFLSTNRTLPAFDLGTLGGNLSSGLGINSYDWTVGWSDTPEQSGPHAFVHDGTQMVDLNARLWNPSGWLLREAMAINDAGQIVGEGYHNGALRAFLLQPMSRSPVIIPCGVIVIGPLQ